MIRSKNTTILAVIVISGLLLFSLSAFAQWHGENGYHGDHNDIDYRGLTGEQREEVEQIHDEYFEEIIPLQNELRSLQTEVYNYRRNDDVNIERIREYRQQMRELRGEIDDLRLDALGEVYDIIPGDKQDHFSNHFNQCFGYGNKGMKYGNMGNRMHGMKHNQGMHDGRMMHRSGMRNGCGWMSGNNNHR